jgi:hypothetical protein
MPNAYRLRLVVLVAISLLCAGCDEMWDCDRSGTMQDPLNQAIAPERVSYAIGHAPKSIEYEGGNSGELIFSDSHHASGRAHYKKSKFTRDDFDAIDFTVQGDYKAEYDYNITIRHEADGGLIVRFAGSPVWVKYVKRPSRRD